MSVGQSVVGGRSGQRFVGARQPFGVSHALLIARDLFLGEDVDLLVRVVLFVLKPAGPGRNVGFIIACGLDVAAGWAALGVDSRRQKEDVAFEGKHIKIT